MGTVYIPWKIALLVGLMERIVHAWLDRPYLLVHISEACESSIMALGCFMFIFSDLGDNRFSFFHGRLSTTRLLTRSFTLM